MARASSARRTGTDARKVGAAVARAAAGGVRGEVGTLLLVGVGSLARRAAELVEGAAEALPQATVLALGASAGFDPGGEHAGEPAALALALRSAASLGFGAEAEAIGHEVQHRPARPTLVFGRRALTPSALEAFAAASRTPHVLGGALDPGASLACRRPGEPGAEPELVALRLDGGLRLALEHSTAVRPLGPERRVTATEAGFVTELDGEPALQHLAAAARGEEGRPLVLARTARPGAGAILRGIGGVDPRRSGIYVGEDVVIDDTLGYVTPDGDSAAPDLEAAARRLVQAAGGGFPVLLAAVSSVGRGKRLHGRAGAEGQLLRARAPEGVPLFGVRSSAEIVRTGDALRLAGHTVTLGLLFAPS